jgi:NAD(P)-dependent dehydrogenase (short-subunit alcohol dehydrogenase family)
MAAEPAAWSVAAGLEGKGVVVTGVGRGIGRAVARAFATTGARVCGIDLTDEAAGAFLAETADASRHLAIGCDLTDVDRHDAVLRDVVAAFGRFDVLAHVAGVARRRQLEDVTEDDWDLQTDVNLKATFFLDRTAGFLLREQGRGGAIVNFSSQGWWTGGFGGSVVYAAGKGGIVSITRGLARTFGPDGIRVNAVAPGLVDTPMLTTGITREALDALVAQVPLGYMAQPEDIAGTVVFLASDHARYITGATINITGGWLMY